MIKNSPKIPAITLKKVISSRCKLAEGLFITNGRVVWVEITNNLIFIESEFSINVFSTVDKLFIIYDISENKINFGSDAGITVFNSSTEEEFTSNNVSHMHDTIQYRSNDGGFCRQHQLLGFMHRTNPEAQAGFVYKILGETWNLLDDTIHMPNMFVEIEPSKILISDSLTGQIWILELDLNGSLRNKTLWAQLEAGVAPVGGCLVGDFVLIALWDGAAIAFFTKAGELMEKLAVPVVRPTNCKYDAKKGQLWVTSASKGLSKAQLKEYPDSGNKLFFDLEFQ